MPIMAGALYEETCTQFGMYEPNGGLGWGCNSPIPRPNGAGENTYVIHSFSFYNFILLILSYN